MPKIKKYTVGKPETICWSCARCTGDPNKQCPWVQRFRPVPGWEATPEILQNASAGAQKTFTITDCPLYEEADPWLDFSTFLKDMGVALNSRYAVVSRASTLPLYAKKYERILGQKLPKWIWLEIKKRYVKSTLKDKQKADEKQRLKDFKRFTKEAKVKGEEGDFGTAIIAKGKELGILR